MAPHVLSDLTADEIRHTARLIKHLHRPDELVFKAITLDEPRKELVLEYFRAQLNGEPLPVVPRIVFAAYYIKGTDRFIATYVNLTDNTVQRTDTVSPKYHGNIDFIEVVEVEQITMKDPRVMAEIEKLKLPPHLEVIPEAWHFGSDGMPGSERRQYQVYMFVGETKNPDSNYYARPLAFSPVVDVSKGVVTQIDYIATGSTHTADKDTKPWEFREGNEYVPEALKIRDGLRPLQVTQPQGTSFTIDADNVLQWQKWSMRVCFNYREGLLLRDVRYEGRPIFYRVSLSEMTVPYADPRPPYHRKQAFDLGDIGAGLTANNLALGCDCLGSITYLDGLVADPKGEPMVKQNAICIHEQDAGIGWKHTNYRTERACVVRNREIVLQQILTVSNYEYILAFVFNQAGEMHYEVRATGILSTAAIDRGESVPWGTVVHDGVLAQHHQHLLSLRVDPAIGSYEHGNQLAYSECYALPMDKDFNPHGNGYISKTHVVERPGGLDLDASKSRVYMMQNDNIRNVVNQKPISYKIQVPPMQGILAHPDSFHFKRAEFADHSIYLTKYGHDELFSGGRYTNQSRGGDGIKSWASRNDNVVNDDIVVWIQFGMNHVPRIEDFPVMPVEIMKVAFKPVNFFIKNPSIDVPASTQQANKSTLVSRDGKSVAPQQCCSSDAVSTKAESKL